MIYLNMVLEWVKDWALISILLLWLTWVFFTAVMRLRELRDAGKLAYKNGPFRYVFAWLTLIIGLVLDVLVNIIVATVILMELPKEALTTARLCRWYRSTDTSWYTRNVRMRFVRFGQQMLDVVDTDGQHIK